MILLVLLVIPPCICAKTIKEKVLNIYQGVTYKTHKTKISSNQIIQNRAALHRSSEILNIKTALSLFKQCYLATKLTSLTEENNAST